jgi:hypothetical protein
MWITVLVMDIAVSMEPFRIAMTVLMLNRPRPTLQLLAFLAGGFAMAATVGLVVLFAFQPGLLRSAHFTLPKVQIMIGALRCWWLPCSPQGLCLRPNCQREHEALRSARPCGWPEWRAWGSRCLLSTTLRFLP